MDIIDKTKKKVEQVVQDIQPTSSSQASALSISYSNITSLIKELIGLIDKIKNEVQYPKLKEQIDSVSKPLQDKQEELEDVKEKLQLPDGEESEVAKSLPKDFEQITKSQSPPEEKDITIFSFLIKTINLLLIEYSNLANLVYATKSNPEVSTTLNTTLTKFHDLYKELISMQKDILANASQKSPESEAKQKISELEKQIQDQQKQLDELKQKTQ